MKKNLNDECCDVFDKCFFKRINTSSLRDRDSNDIFAWKLLFEIIIFVFTDEINLIKNQNPWLLRADIIEDIIHNIHLFIQEGIRDIDDMQQQITFYTIFERR